MSHQPAKPERIPNVADLDPATRRLYESLAKAKANADAKRDRERQS